MVLTLADPGPRAVSNLKDIITIRHLENMAKIILVTGMMVGYAYAMEFFIAWYCGNPYERFAFVNRALGPVRVGLLDHDLLQRDRPQLFWFKRAAPAIRAAVRRALLVNVGMWFERFVIIVDLAAPRLPAVAAGACSSRPGSTC